MSRIRCVRRETFLLLGAGVCVMVLTGCAVLGPKEEVDPPLPRMTAVYTSEPVKIDGNLDDPAWQTARVYPLCISQDKVELEKVLAEPGEARVAWDDKYLYVGVRFHDSDIAAEGEEDQLHHYKMGDLVELFLKPENSTWYWELYATPRGKRTSFWFPGRGRLGLESGFQYSCGLRVAARCEGTLNNWKDRDTACTAEMAMPLTDLTAHGDRFCPGAEWRILVSRYNYSRYLPWKELSMTPQLSRSSYHLYEEYAVLELVR